MQHTSGTPPRRAESPRPATQRQRSNSFPIVEALGCSTPEARLILAEGRAAVRKRRAQSRRNRSVNDQVITTFDPRDHVTYLDTLAALPTPQERPYTSERKNGHSRFPSDATDRSTLTIVPQHGHCASPPNVSPLGDYSANLAQFIKAQLKSIPTYNASTQAISPLSPRSCPDLFFPTQSPPQSPTSPRQAGRRPTEAPNMISIPPVQAPMRSAFSAWSSTDDGMDDETRPLPSFEFGCRGTMSKGDNYTPSVLGYYETTNSSSFLLSSTPLEEQSDPDTATGFTFPDHSTLPGSCIQEQDNSDYPSSSLSHMQPTSSSAPSYTSSASTSSYFDCKRSLAIGPHMKDRVIAAVTPSKAQNTMLTAISPWEGGALSNVHDVFIESQQRVHVDGMSFDMIRDFVVPPGGVPTPV